MYDQQTNSTRFAKQESPEMLISGDLISVNAYVD
jgi:hypothetical protein